MNIHPHNTPINQANQAETFEEDYKAIFDVLDEFIDHNKIKKYSHKKQPWINKDSFLGLTIPFLSLVYSFILIGFKIQPNTLLFWIISIVFLLASLILLIMIVLKLNKERQKAKNTPNILIRKSWEKGLGYLAFSKKLTEFDKSSLNYAERILKLLVETRNTNNSQINNIIPFMALVIGIFIIYTYSSKDFNFTPANIMLTSGIIAIIFKGVTELTDDKTIYTKCLAAVEYARILAEQYQEEEVNYLPKKNVINNDIMEVLQKHKIDQPSDFDHNS